MVGHLIPRENTVWGIYIKLLQTVETCCTNEFRNSDAPATGWDEYFLSKLCCFPKYIYEA